MAESQTWRVVLASGEVREVRVEVSDDGRVWAESADGAAEGYGESPHRAVARVARFLGVAFAEILAPGEPTRAELVAQLAAVTAERDDARAALATARREGAEGMRWEASEAAEQWLREVAEVTEDSPADLADAIRALPLDGDGGEL